jgi:lysophospholipase L1-like esterase
MLKAEIPSRDYFPSDQLAIPRGPDGIHPTARGYAGWAGAIWQWLA